MTFHHIIEADKSYALKTSERNGNMVSAVAVDENDGIIISDKGTLIRTAISQIPTLGRNTQG